MLSQDGNTLFHGLRVRMGLHFGNTHNDSDPITKRSTYYGPNVNVAVLLEKISHGGQIVIT